MITNREIANAANEWQLRQDVVEKDYVLGWLLAGIANNRLVARDKASLDIFWLRDESVEDTDNLPPPGVIAAEIVEDLEAALAEFTELAESLQGIGVEIDTEEA